MTKKHAQNLHGLFYLLGCGRGRLGVIGLKNGYFLMYKNRLKKVNKKPAELKLESNYGPIILDFL